jgi:hypothetical protein
MNKDRDTNKPSRASHIGRKLVNVVPMVVVFILGLVVGMTYNSFMLLTWPPLHTLLPPSPFRGTLSLPPSAPSSAPAASPPLRYDDPPRIGGLASFVSPSGVMHNMSDEELFWRASMVPQVRRTPYRRVPKVALLFLARGDLPLRPLWEKFLAGHDGLYSIYVHASPSYAGSPPPSSSVFYGRMIPSQVNENNVRSTTS